MVVVGGGAAGLAAAEILAARADVTLIERMPSVGRKFLLAGRGGLNLTHSEPIGRFLSRYGAAEPWLRPAVEAFTPDALQSWCEELGQPCFTGSSGRVFPRAMKASPLLRAWLGRLDRRGVRIRTRCRMVALEPDALLVETPDGVERLQPDAVLLALGGASWARLGSDGSWAPALSAAGIAVSPFRPSNCGFSTTWSEGFRSRFAGMPLKSVGLRFDGAVARGDVVVTRDGLEGGAIYPLSAALRCAIDAGGSAALSLDLRPDLDRDALAARLARVRGRESLSNTLRKALSLSPAAIALLLRDAGDAPPPRDPAGLAALVKAVPVTLTAPAPMDRAISTAGGVRRDAVDDRFMLLARPGAFVAGEMLDWDAPTGGYLLQASIATGRAAACGMLDWLRTPSGEGTSSH